MEDPNGPIALALPTSAPTDNRLSNSFFMRRHFRRRILDLLAKIENSDLPGFGFGMFPVDKTGLRIYNNSLLICN
jgi:hypothetical protein